MIPAEEEESVPVLNRPAVSPLSVTSALSGQLPEEMRWLPEQELELALMEYQKWYYASEGIIRSHQPIKCMGLIKGHLCDVCKSGHGSSDYGRTVYLYYQKVILPEPLWQDDPNAPDEGFDPFEVEAGIIVNKLQNPDDKFEKAHDHAYQVHGVQIEPQPNATLQVIREIEAAKWNRGVTRW